MKGNSMAAQTAWAVTPAEVRSLLRQIQQETILFVLPALYAAGLGLFALANGRQDPLEAILPCLAVIVLGGSVWALHRLSYLATAWVLVLGSSATVLLAAALMHLEAALSLLALPVGLAALFIGTPAGVLVAMASSLMLLCVPPTFLIASPEQRILGLIGLWGNVGLISLATQPLLTALQWSWANYQRAQSLLEQARDQRQQLKEALDDLADANLQLNRLNRLAQDLRRAAEDARRAKERFVANVSHELRTPLNMVIGFSETILQAPEAYGGRIPPALLADLRVILRNSQHLSALIDDVLDLSQIEASQMALSREWVELAEITEEATVAVQPLFTSKGLYLVAQVAESLPMVYCDRTRIREVLLNLLSNAGRFTEQGGVRVRAWQEGTNVVVSVADTGPGIAERDQERLFHPFEQLDGSLRRHYGGTGLGLSISKSFVELHGGRMWLQSQVGEGTTFYFCLPVDLPAGITRSRPHASPSGKGEDEKPEPSPTPSEGSVLQWLRPDWEYAQRLHPSRVSPPAFRPRLIVLESGNSLQRMLGRYLEQVELAPVTSFAAALQELARAPAQALLINEMAVGDALGRLITEGLPSDGTPVLICSIPGTYEAATALGVADYLVKPIPRDALLATLDRLKVNGKTLLVVDDDAEVTRLFRRMLNSYGRGYRVLTTGEGRQALQMMRDEHPDVLLLDLAMPGMDGFQLLAEKNSDPSLRDIPVIVISARDPAGHPIVTNVVAITRNGGLTMPQLLACLRAISGDTLASLSTGQPIKG